MNPTNERTRRLRTWIGGAAAAAGIALGAAGIASAATNDPIDTTAATTADATDPTTDPTTADTTDPTTADTTADADGDAPHGQDPATMDHGPGETLLTGDTASQVEAAALVAEPGATIIRVETDSAGAAYEAHITKADGTQATLTFDDSFTLVETIEGFGGPGGGHGGPAGDRGHGPDDTGTSDTRTSDSGTSVTTG